VDVVGEILNNDPPPKKCSYRKCRSSTSSQDGTWQLLPCANAVHKKFIHCLCFEHFLSISNLAFEVKLMTFAAQLFVVAQSLN
jgi:hypothetical protein